MPTPEHRLTVCGVDELRGHLHAGVDFLLSALSKPEIEEHRKAWAKFYGVEHVVLDFEDVSMPKPGACDADHIRRLLAFGERVQAKPDSHVLVHCHAGISRSTALAAVLLAQHAPGREDEAFARVRAVRPQAVPNIHVIQVADEVMGRNGALLDALDRFHGSA